MTLYDLQLYRYFLFTRQVKCILLFMFLITPLIVAISLVRHSSTWLFHGGAFFIGWVSWTFIEYFLHRFWSHGNHTKANRASVQSHHYHHAHPTEIIVTRTQRGLLLVLSCLFIYLSVLFNNYFTILAGLFFGFTGYIYMHYFLHQKWSAIVFPTLHRFHIYHHCKYPNHCHGISVPWWDLLFHTAPPTEAKLSDRIINFYFGNKGLIV